MQQSIRKTWVERQCETRDIDEGKEVQTDQLVDNMGQGQEQGQDNPLGGMKKMMKGDKIDEGWRVTTRDKGWTKRSKLCETKMRTIMREKNVDNEGDMQSSAEHGWWPWEQAAMIFLYAFDEENVPRLDFFHFEWHMSICYTRTRSGSNWFYVIISIVTTFNCVIYYPCCVHCRLDITSFCWAISSSNRIYRCCCSLNNIVIVPAAECAIVVATAVLWSLSSTKIILFPNTTSQFLRLHLELFYASQHSWYHPFLVIIRALLFNAVVISPCHSTTNSERRKG